MPTEPNDDSDFDIDIDDSDLEGSDLEDSDIEDSDIEDNDLDEDDSNVIDNADTKQKMNDSDKDEDQQLSDFYKKHPEQYGKWVDDNADFIHSEDEKEGIEK